MNATRLGLIAAAAATFALVGCGGGGGGGGGGGMPLLPIGAAPAPATPEAPVTPPVANPEVPATNPDNGAGADSSLVGTVGNPTYAGASEENAAFVKLNFERERCGFGLLAQNAALDTAAAGHANYLLRNNFAGHVQDNTLPFFTGVGAAERATAAGYNWAIVLDDNNDATGGSANVLTGRGQEGVRSLLSAPYHALSLLSPELDIGVSVMSSDFTGTTGTHGPRSIVQFNIGIQAGSFSQKPRGDFVQTFPCDGTMATAHTLSNESPNPIPGRDLAVNPVGQPIIVAVRPGQMVDITSATMVKLSDSTPVTLRPVMTKQNDPNGMIDWSRAVIIPDAPLEPSTSYTVTIKGTNTTATFPNGVGTSTGTNPLITDNSEGKFTKTFTFTTGA